MRPFCVLFPTGSWIPKLLWLLSVPWRLWPTRGQLQSSGKTLTSQDMKRRMTSRSAYRMILFLFSSLRRWSASAVIPLSISRIRGEFHVRSPLTRDQYSSRPVVFEHLSALLATPTQYSILLIERAVVSLLRICLILAQRVCSPYLTRILILSFSFTHNSPPSGIKYTFPSTSLRVYHRSSQTQWPSKLQRAWL